MNYQVEAYEQASVRREQSLNEIVILISAYFFWVFNMVNEEQNFTLGYIAVGFILAYLAIGILIMIFQTITGIVKKLRYR